VCIILLTRKIGAATRRAPLDDSDAKNEDKFYTTEKHKDNMLVFHCEKGAPVPDGISN
jgi:hypothetical protein